MVVRLESKEGNDNCWLAVKAYGDEVGTPVIITGEAFQQMRNEYPWARRGMEFRVPVTASCRLQTGEKVFICHNEIEIEFCPKHRR
jgi:hypothetical protein